METTIDRFGRVVIPKQMREDLGLRPGAALRLEEDREGILLRPLRDEPPVVDRQGVLVFRGRATADLAQAVQAQRAERMTHLARRRPR